MNKVQQENQLKKLISETHIAGVRLGQELNYLVALNKRRRNLLAQLEGQQQKINSKQFGLDWAWGSISPNTLRNAHATFACRYLSYDSGKNLSPTESKILGRAGIGRVVVWETTATRAQDGFSSGQADAHQAHLQASKCGKPDGAPIFFAVDFDTTGNGSVIHSYFDGVKSVLGLQRTGCYGGLESIRTLFDTNRIAFGWQTYAWSYGAWDKRAHLQQFSNGHTVGGVSVDFNRTDGNSVFGQW